MKKGENTFVPLVLLVGVIILLFQGTSSLFDGFSLGPNTEALQADLASWEAEQTPPRLTLTVPVTSTKRTIEVRVEVQPITPTSKISLWFTDLTTGTRQVVKEETGSGGLSIEVDLPYDGTFDISGTARKCVVVPSRWVSVAKGDSGCLGSPEQRETVMVDSTKPSISEGVFKYDRESLVFTGKTTDWGGSGVKTVILANTRGRIVGQTRLTKDGPFELKAPYGVFTSSVQLTIEDGFGNSSSAWIELDKTPPELVISPFADTTSLVIKGMAVDDSGIDKAVVLDQAGQILAEIPVETSGLFELRLAWDRINGDLKVVVVDRLGNQSTPRRITIDPAYVFPPNAWVRLADEGLQINTTKGHNCILGWCWGSTWYHYLDRQLVGVAETNRWWYVLGTLVLVVVLAIVFATAFYPSIQSGRLLLRVSKILHEKVTSATPPQAGSAENHEEEAR